MVDQQQCHISLVYRQENGHWWVKTFTEIDDIIKLPCPEMEIKVVDIYESTSF